MTTRKAASGEKMIEVKLRFWTNGIAMGGKIKPKHAWDSGVVRMEPNASHGIKPKRPKPFHSLGNAASGVEDVLIAHGIELHSGRKSKKFRVK